MTTDPEPHTRATPAALIRAQRLAKIAAAVAPARQRAYERQAAAGWPSDAWTCETTEPHECAVDFHLSPEIERELLIEERRILGDHGLD